MGIQLLVRTLLGPTLITGEGFVVPEFGLFKGH